MVSCICILSNLIFGATVYAGYTSCGTGCYRTDTCSQSDFNSAHSAASDGNTIQISSGDCNWSSTSTVTKGINVIGDGIDITNLTQTTASSPIFDFSVAEGKSWSISYLTIKDNGGDNANGVFAITGSNKSWRVHHIKLSNITRRGIFITGHTYGVIDHCTFTKTGSAEYNSIYIQEASSQGDINNVHTTWTRAIPAGTANAVFVEDCTFDFAALNDGAVDGRNGAKLVFRYNDVKNTLIGGHGCDSVIRSFMWVEAYNNTFHTTTSIWMAIQFRGGTGLMYNNSIDSGYGTAIGLTNYRSTTASNPCSVCDGGDWCCMGGGHRTCDGNDSTDGNTSPIETYHGWPCRDQIGRGTNQGSYPLYTWNNGGKTASTYCDSGDCAYVTTHIQSNRDYYNATDLSDAISKGLYTYYPSYTAYTYPHPLTGTASLSGVKISGGSVR